MRREEWYVFQEKIAEHFRSLGAEATTNYRARGVRTEHDIDIYVRSKFLGQSITWIVEAKFWQSAVGKAQVLTLRQIVEDVGADRGFLITQFGFQRGAHEAATNTNVKLRTFDQMKSETKGVIELEVLKSYQKRLRIIEERYWSHSKNVRIKYGLRHDIGEYPIRFVGQILLQIAQDAIENAKMRSYPIKLRNILTEQKGEATLHSFPEVTNWLNLNLNHFDEKLLEAEWSMIKNGDFNPETDRLPDTESTVSEMFAIARWRPHDLDQLDTNWTP